MTTQHDSELSKSTHYPDRWHRALFSGGTTLALVLILAFSPDATLVHATSMLGALREPGEPAFIAGHRGDRASFPENTLPALQAVLDSDFDFVEADVQLTSDSVPVVIHDETVERTTNGTGAVAELTLEQIKTLDAGSWYSPEFASVTVPTLDEFLAIFQNSRKKAMVELKGEWSPEQVTIVVELVYARGVQNRIIFEAFDYGTLESMLEVAPTIPRVLIKRLLPADPVSLAEKYGAIAILTSPESLERDPTVVDAMHRAGLGIVIYTLNSKKRWSAALALGVDGIITDRPSSLDKWLAETAPGT